MELERAVVDHVARLARLDLSEEERERMAPELSKILDHAARIQALSLDEVPPTSHSLPLRNVMRPDEPRPSLHPDDALANAPQAEEGRFMVPRILEEE